MSDQEQQEREKWHIKKEVSVGHILTTILIGISLVAWGNSVEKRVTALEVANTYDNAAFKRIEATLVRIEGKIDQKADK